MVNVILDFVFEVENIKLLGVLLDKSAVPIIFVEVKQGVDQRLPILFMKKHAGLFGYHGFGGAARGKGNDRSAACHAFKWGDSKILYLWVNEGLSSL